MPPIPRLTRRLQAAAVGGLCLALGACEDGRGPFDRLFNKDPVVSAWARDSVILASEPEVLFRVLPDAGGAYVVPMASIGPQGLRALKFTQRGWRRLDADYLVAGKSLTLYRNGVAAEPMRMFRGMWQPGTGPIDTLNCPVVVPIARAIVSNAGGFGSIPPFATSGTRPPLKYGPTLDQAAINTALSNIGTLVAPSSGIPPGQLSRYERQVHQIPSGVNGSSSLVVEYNDPTPLPDTLKPYGERPRQMIVILDKGTYGFKPGYSFSTLGGRNAAPKLEYLDFLDVDDDGVPEIMLGLKERQLAPLYTIVLRYENDAWRELFRYTGNRCDF
jgi:hypothetical protein